MFYENGGTFDHFDHCYGVYYGEKFGVYCYAICVLFYGYKLSKIMCFNWIILVEILAGKQSKKW